MKKMIIIITAAVFALALAACSGQKAQETSAETTQGSTDPGTFVVGGWEMPKEVSGTMSNEASKAFEKAKENYDDASLSAIQELGSQVVSGTNYMLLCSNMGGDHWKVAIVYEDLSGKAEITKVTDFDIAKYSQDENGKAGEQGLAGGWKTFEDVMDKDDVLPDDVEDAFEKATEGLTGAEYHPLTYLGSQVVSGTNYAILCEQTLVTAEPVKNLAIVYVYAPLEGDAEILNIYPLDLAAFNQ